MSPHDQTELGNNYINYTILSLSAILVICMVGVFTDLFNTSVVITTVSLLAVCTVGNITTGLILKKKASSRRSNNESNYTNAKPAQKKENATLHYAQDGSKQVVHTSSSKVTLLS